MEAGINVFFIATVFIAGVLSFFSPCVLPLLPVYMGKLMEGGDERKVSIGRMSINVVPVVKTLLFIFGLSFVFFSLGFGAGVLGVFLYHPYTSIVLGIVVILLGLHQGEWINMSLLQREKKVEWHRGNQKGYGEAFLLGLTFSFGWTPCVGPVLGSVLAIAVSGEHSAWYGGFLTAVYTLGMALPFLVLALASSWALKYMNRAKKHMIFLKKCGGILIILMGIVLMTGNMNQLTSFL